MEYIVDKDWLKQHLNSNDVSIVDCRFYLGDPAEGSKLYQESHIPGAYYFDLEEHMSSPVREHGGRHPLPEIHLFRQEIEKAGIDNNKIVVAYDGGEGQFASRFWWLLTFLGHDKVYVLKEGFKGWTAACYPITKEVPKHEPTSFTINLRKEMLASYEEVKEVVEQTEKTAVLIDSRDSNRYLGEAEPMDRIPGHIPGAINKFWADGIESGSFKSEQDQKQRFADLDREKPVIVYCGSGVTATPNYIALKMAGFQHVKLYAGSYSDWVSYHENPVTKGNE